LVPCGDYGLVYQEGRTGREVLMMTKKEVLTKVKSLEQSLNFQAKLSKSEKWHSFLVIELRRAFPCTNESQVGHFIEGIVDDYVWGF
jgi:hypothetical protein